MLQFLRELLSILLLLKKVKDQVSSKQLWLNVITFYHNVTNV